MFEPTLASELVPIETRNFNKPNVYIETQKGRHAISANQPGPVLTFVSSPNLGQECWNQTNATRLRTGSTITVIIPEN